VPSKADIDSIYSYAVLRYLTDSQREITVPLGVILWSADQGRLCFRLPRQHEEIVGAPAAQARAYAEIARSKIQGWYELGRLPYQKEPLAPLSDAWWEAVRALLQWRVRLGPVRVVTCYDPEQELESLYEALVQPLRPVEGQAAEDSPRDRQEVKVVAAE
jgi:hypothetical protein